MSYLYVNEQGSKIGYTGHRFEITKEEATLKSIPGETVENIEVFGNVQLTTQCIEECLRQGHNVTFYSSNGTYYGRLMSTGHVNVSRQRLQARLSEQFMNEVSKRIIKAKIKNQSVILRRYARNKDVNVNSGIGGMLAIAKHIDSCTDTEKLMGFIVQRSAFEAIISERLFVKLKREIPHMINGEEDSVRIYRMTGYGEVDLYGVNKQLKAEDVIIVC